jgi:hypothetical protein
VCYTVLLIDTGHSIGIGEMSRNKQSAIGRGTMPDDQRESQSLYICTSG